MIKFGLALIFCLTHRLIGTLHEWIFIYNYSKVGNLKIARWHGRFHSQLSRHNVTERINPQLPLIEKPLPEDDPRQRRPLIDLARQQLGWQPTVSLEQGLGPTIDSFRSVLALEEDRGA